MASPPTTEVARGDQQYIFNETEFEGETFNAASFVAKYRRVTSLESLRDQLRGYGSGLKDQLYETINRDYKDFIDIATKLEGVDTRVQHLKKPLIDLRIEALSLHDGIVTSLETIQQKLRKKSELRQRALLLETTLSCMTKFDDIEKLLAALDPAPRRVLTGELESTAAEADKCCTRRSDLVRYVSMREARRISSETTKKGSDQSKQQLTYHQTQCTKALHVMRAQLLKSSEQERAAHALASAKGSIKLLAERLEQHSSSAGPSSRSARSNSIGNGESTSASVAELSDRASRLEAGIVSRTHEILMQVLVSSPSVQNLSCESSDGDGADSKGPEAAVRGLRTRILGHVLRTLKVLGRGDIAQTILCENISYPLARSVLSQGRVDGTGGRGFYAGLEEALLHIIEHLGSAPGVRELLLLAEEIFCKHHDSSATEKVDFLVCGVWKPVATVLAERFQGMFSVGVAVAMHRAFTALERFIKEIPRVLLAKEGTETGDKNFDAMVNASYGRMCRHPEVVGFRNKWKLDLYFQLRRQEITTRLEHAISLLSPVGPDNTRTITVRSDAAATMELVYFSEQQPLQAAATQSKTSGPGKAVPGAATATPVAARSVIPRTLPTDIAKSVVDAVETAIQQTWENSSNSGEVLKFKLPLIKAVVIEISSCLHSTVFLSALAGPFLALIVQLFIRLEAQICAAVPQINPPSFSSHEAVVKALQQTTSSNTSSASNSSVYTTVDDLVDLLGDLMLMRQWMVSALPDLIFLRIRGDGLYTEEAENSLKNAVSKSLSVQAQKILSLMTGVWLRASSMICTDCKSSLQAVKGVAGKYRLTNKPPPESSSPFVVTILNPLREFMSKYSPIVNSIRASMQQGDVDGNDASNRLWQGYIVEDVTASYLQQVQSLVETARQMDSVFMKRSKAAASSAPKSGGASLSDSEKIALQMIFDINAFEQEIAEMKKLFQNL